ncbi:MAG: hypothetical protein KBG20_18980 [Caldilineaceae bacterium]|nr:hypothetical protein [Caldilineaceae bacterium]MBP8108531.1 hypothetical protein [Caldilineaceae bacterium]MBP8123533.1 hypothetical protein [Caldilineaceae bacterium]MBP9074399.1 hypothetical protein [Caldilineaceae bacterium]
MDDSILSENGTGGESFINTTVSDELYDELAELEGLQVVGAALWEDSLSDNPDSEEGADGEEAEESIDPEGRQFVDMDIYLDENVQLELYEVALYTSLDEDPIMGLTAIGTLLSKEIEAGLWLEEVAVDEDEQLVLVMTRQHEPVFYLNVGGWSTSEWDELPEDEE